MLAREFQSWVPKSLYCCRSPLERLRRPRRRATRGIPFSFVSSLFFSFVWTFNKKWIAYNMAPYWKYPGLLKLPLARWHPAEPILIIGLEFPFKNKPLSFGTLRWWNQISCNLFREIVRPPTSKEAQICFNLGELVQKSHFSLLLWWGVFLVSGKIYKRECNDLFEKSSLK